MDVFRFTNPTAPMKMEQGVLIKGLKSKMWVERYAEGGEFTFVADVKSDLKNQLPIGSFVSHVDTSEIMIVENHEITDKKDADSEIKVTGRGFETDFENRIVGSNKAYPTSGATVEFALVAGYLAAQIVTLIQQHILAVNLLDANDALPFTTVVNQVAAGGESVARSLKRGTLYTRMQELLAVQTLGIKVIRPGPWSPLGAADPNTCVAIHVGVNRTASIIFSHDTGEIDTADYLWSNKKDKNAAMVSGRWVETRVVGAETGHARRWMFVDASDLDNSLAAAPVGAALDAIVAQMQQRGSEVLATQNPIALTKAEVSKNASKATYRKDFDVGDLITVHGSYNDSTILRISEYVEIEDETGSSSYPTLTVV